MNDLIDTAAAAAATNAAIDEARARRQAQAMTQTQAQKHAFEMNKLSKRLHRLVGQAIVDFNMIEEGDRVMVCLSGGKDSYGLLDVLMGLQKRAPINFTLFAVNLDQKQPGFPAHILPEYLAGLGIEHHIENQDTYSIVKKLVPEGKTMCSLCSRLRRGILYRVAGELGATKIALGHHRDDIVVTMLMNMFFGSRLKGMPPKLVSDNGLHTVIRPLAYVAEADLASWATHRQFPIIPCTLCGSQDNLQRVQVKKMLHGWERQYPGRIDNMATAMGNISLSHLMDRTLFPFTTIAPTGRADPAGDKAFDDDDEEACAAPTTAGDAAGDAASHAAGGAAAPQVIQWLRAD